jgi:hypothetical protein
MATTRIKDLSKTATTVNSDANLVLDGNTGGTQKISRDNFRQDTADAFVAAPGTYNLAPLNSGTGKIDAVYLSSSSDTPKGAWDASTNTPTLADGSGTAGDYYDVTVAGSSDLGSGSIAFTVGDVVKYNGTVWFKIDSVANILDGVSTIDGAKTAIEIPDVGTAPNEVPLNGMLGSMAFQSSEGISVAKAEVETLEVTDKVSGTLNIATGSPEAIADADADDLVIGDGVLTNFGATIATNSSGQAKINFADGAGANAARGQIKYDHQFDKLSVSTAGGERVVVDEYGRVGIGTASIANKLTVEPADNDGILIDSNNDGRTGYLYFGDASSKTVGAVSYDHYSDSLRFNTAGSQRWTINSSGNLVASSGVGIDFGAVAGGTGTPATNGGLLDDYERGTATPTDASGAGLTLAGVGCNYVKIGSQVTAWVRVTYPTTSDTSFAKIGGFPFPFGASDIDRIGGFVVYQNTGLDVSVLGSNSVAEVTFRNNSGNEYTNANLSGKTIWFCVTYDVS